MEKRLSLTDVQNQVPAPSNRQLQKIGKSLLPALLEKRLELATFEEAKQPLRYAMMVVGLKAENFPTQIQSQILVNFVVENYPDYTASEIQFIFEKAMARKLPVKDPLCYENFSCEYIGRLFTAYESWHYTDTEISSLHLAQMEPDDWRIQANAAYQDFLAGRTVKMIMPTRLFYRLEEDGVAAVREIPHRPLRIFQAHLMVISTFERLRKKGQDAIYVYEPTLALPDIKK